MSIGIGSLSWILFIVLIAFSGINTLFISLLPHTVEKFYTENYLKIIITVTYSGCLLVIGYGVKLMNTKVSSDQLTGKEKNHIHRVERKKLRKLAHSHPIAGAHKSQVSISNLVLGILLCFSSITLPASWIGVVTT